MTVFIKNKTKCNKLFLCPPPFNHMFLSAIQCAYARFRLIFRCVNSRLHVAIDIWYRTSPMSGTSPMSEGGGVGYVWWKYIRCFHIAFGVNSSMSEQKGWYFAYDIFKYRVVCVKDQLPFRMIYSKNNSLFWQNVEKWNLHDIGTVWFLASDDWA